MKAVMMKAAARKKAGGLLLAVLAGSLLVGCGGQELDATGAVAEADLGSSTQEVSTGHHPYTEIFNRLDKPWGWVQGDSAGSVNDLNGNTLWTFGDSILGTVNSTYGTLNNDLKWVSNSIVVTNSSEFRTYQGGTQSVPAALIKDFTGSDGSRRFHWMYMPVFDQYMTLRVFAARIKHLDPASGCGDYCFAHEASILATFNWNASDKTLTYISQRVNPRPDISWGEAVFKDDPKGYFYIYGSKPGAFGNDTYVARVGYNATLVGTWQFWGGSNYGWTTDGSKAAIILNGHSIQSVTKRGDVYYATYTFIPGNTIWEGTSYFPEGPFSKTELYTVPEVDYYHQQYIPRLHGQFNTATTQVLGYSINVRNKGIPGPGQLNVYRPRFRTVYR